MVVNFPTDNSCVVEKFTFGVQRNDLLFRSSFGSQSSEISPPQWTASLSAPTNYEAVSGAWQALLMKIKGQTNQVALWNMGRPAPLGTLRGSVTFASTAAQGNTWIHLSAGYGSSNLLTFPESFDNAAWDKISGASVTVNTDVAPDGTLTMDTIIGVNAVVAFIQSQVVTITPSVSHTASVYVKAGTATGSQIKVYDGSVVTQIAGLVINWSAGVPSIASSVGVTATPIITPIGGEIYRVSMAFNSGAFTTARVLLYPCANTTATTTKIWGTKLEQGALTEYGYGKTLKAGDMLGFGSGTTQQLCMVVNDITSTSQGLVSVDVEPPLRYPMLAGVVVTWDKPCALFRRSDSKSSWEYAANMASSFSLNLIEDVRP